MPNCTVPFMMRRLRVRPSVSAAATLALLMTTALAGQGGDVTPPAVAVQSPAAGASGVSTLIVVKATFSEPVQAATVAMTLRNSSNQLLASSVAYDAGTRTATLSPTAELAGSQVFTASVTGGRDLAGNLMSPVTWSFTTGTAGFQDVTLPQTGLVNPTVIQFAADGRVFVAEKSGRIYAFDSLTDTTPTLVADLRTSVHNYWDRGLLGMALHPNFPSIPLLYVLYSYDALPGGSAPQWGVAGQVSDTCPTPPGATTNGCVITGRLSSFNVGNPGAFPLTAVSENVLISDWFQQFPSHSTGSLAFGADGALYATAGDGASFNYADYGQTASTPSANDPATEGGALRSQDVRTSGDPVALNGSVIRIDPETGLDLAGNPRSTDPDANGRRIVAHGLRNPYRMTVRPGTNEIWIGDVGWSTWEEINRVVDGSDGVVENFGWPCYEGAAAQSGYQGLNLGICLGLSAGQVTAPYYTYNHSAKVVAGEACGTGSSSIAGLAFYPQTGGTYPAPYRGALFFADYSRQCIWAMRPGANTLPDPNDRVTIKSGAAGPAYLVSGPGGDIFYAGYSDGRLHRITYASGNLSPTAALQASSTSGALPLVVNFNATGSSDPEGQGVTYAWDLDGDGAFDDSTSASPSMTYTVKAAVTVRLRVSDPQGLSDVSAILIWPGNTAPVATMTSPSPLLTWRVGDTIVFSGGASDGEEGTLPASALSWALVMQHCPSNCHSHDIQSFQGIAGGSFAAPDHEYPSYLELRLTATDSGGLQTTSTVALNPQTVVLTFQSTPAGLQLAVDGSTGTAPFTRTVIVGSSNSISAPSPQTVGPQAYQFSGWSDGGAQIHNILAPAGPTAYSATYVPAAAAPGLIAAYGFNEGTGSVTADATGKGHTATLNGATWSAAGKTGGAVSFNGTSSLVSIADANDLDLTTGMTIEAWVRPTTLSGWRTVGLKEAPGGLAYALYAHDNAPRSAGYVNTGGVDTAVQGASALPLNAWSHLAVTYDGANLRLFVNGAQTATRAVTGAMRTSTGQLSIGGNVAWGEWFAGQMDDLRVYNRALTTGELQTDMITPVGGAPPPDTTPPTVSITAPVAGIFVSGTTTVTASAADNSGTVASVQFLIDGSPSGAPDTSAPFSMAWNTTANAAGVHTVSARATDAAGNQTSSSGVSITVDNVLPSAAVSSPTAGSSVSGTITVSATASDNTSVASVQFRLDGANLGALDTAVPYSVSWVTSGASNGVHLLSAVAFDAAGNQAASANVSVTVSNAWTVPSGLVAAYTFAEGTGTTTADVSSNGQTGTLVGGAAWTTQGRFGKGISFDGVNDLVSVADSNLLGLTTGLTVEAWVSPAVLSGWRTAVFKGAPAGLAYALYAHDNAPLPAAYVNVGGTDVSVGGTAALPLNAWSHLALTYGSGVQRLYVNGVQVGTRTLTGSIRTTGNALTLGGNTVWGEWFSGLIDEVRVYNRALSAAEIQAGMNQTLGGQ